MNGRRKVCFVIEAMGSFGGEERVTSMIANALCDVYDVTILSLWHIGEPRFPIDGRVRVEYLMVRGEGRIMRMWPRYLTMRLRRRFAARRYDVCVNVDPLLTLDVTPALRGLGARIIEWEHFNYHRTLDMPERIRALETAATHSAAIVTLTRRDLELHRDEGRIPERLLRHIPNPTPYEGDVPSPRGSGLAIAVGRLVLQKDFDRLLRIWATIEAVDDAWELAIVGSGPQRDHLTRLADELGLSRVRFVPATDDVEAWYDRASLLLMTSRYEGFPMVLLEAQSKGLPVVAFDCDTGPAEIIDDGANGYLIPQDDDALFAERTLTLMRSRDLQDRFATAALERSRDHRMAPIRSRWIDLIESVASDPAEPR
ncbi:glycosyltransferase [Bifidobacterium samirii]|uniref:Glycosyltransferase n=2 Tax=Bifidobacterium samirii TaxID=2306974 RepID=A0A430FU46_9BIFI|nr:glycosyltransferase [Bifidobacterium samirii]